MNNERIQAEGRVALLKKELIDIGMQAGSHIQTINIELDTILSRKEWHSIDTKKVRFLTKELSQLQKEHLEAIADLEILQEKYGID